MADDKILAETGAEQLVFAPTDQLPIRFSDAFLVAGGDDIFTLNFYQTELPSVEGKVGESGQLQRREVRCFARIALTPLGFTRLAKSMAERVGFDLVKREESN